VLNASVDRVRVTATTRSAFHSKSGSYFLTPPAARRAAFFAALEDVFNMKNMA